MRIHPGVTRLQPMVGADEIVDLGITFEDGKDGAVQVASVNELAFNGFAAEVRSCTRVSCTKTNVTNSTHLTQLFVRSKM